VRTNPLLSVFTFYHFIFFFQAEDGIRDGHVTGVQTCALPIFGHALGDVVQILDNIAQGMTNKEVAYALAISEQTVKNHMSSILRSEERRVGKECRSRWWAYY